MTDIVSACGVTVEDIDRKHGVKKALEKSRAFDGWSGGI
jgi:hypothetical protein